MDIAQLITLMYDQQLSSGLYLHLIFLERLSVKMLGSPCLPYKLEVTAMGPRAGALDLSEFAAPTTLIPSSDVTLALPGLPPFGSNLPRLPAGLSGPLQPAVPIIPLHVEQPDGAPLI